MTLEIKVPTLGESVAEATVGRWYKKAGDSVAADEPLVELETDKVTLEVNAPAAGTLTEIIVAEGTTVGVGALLGMITAGAGGEKTAATGAGRSAPAAPGGSVPSVQAGKADGGGTAMPPAPAARKVLAEAGIDPVNVEGSGRRGQVLKEDAVAAVAASGTRAGGAAPSAQDIASLVPAPTVSSAPRAPVALSDSEREERVRMSKLRQTIARRLKDAQNTAAMLTTFNDVDMTAVMGLRSQYKDVFEKRYGVRLGFMGFFVKAAIQALRDVPAVNGEIDGTDVIYKNYYHIGVAVGTEKGLVVPVLRDADQLSLADIEKRINEFGARARDGNLTIEEMQGGTFTISNGGVYGSLMSTPILNAPQSGILGMHRIEQRPVVRDGAIVARPMMYLALSYDHRIVDGKEAVTFLVRLKENLEDPQRLLIGV